MSGSDEQTERALEARLVEFIRQTPEIDAVALLAFDRVYDDEGRPDDANTHLYVSNDYVMELAGQHPEMLFGASVHPYRADAVVELERCVRGGAVLMKWLPIVQDFDPSDDRCIPFYEALAHHGLTLLCHTGAEHALPNLNKAVADPSLLRPALDRGVKVIMAHCGSRFSPWETDYVPAFMRLAHDYEHCYGDTSALNVPGRWYALQAAMAEKVVCEKLVHGSDWPILPVPPPTRLGFNDTMKLLKEPNWLRRDVLIKQKLGLERGDAYWGRAARVLGLARSAGEVR